MAKKKNVEILPPQPEEPDFFDPDTEDDPDFEAEEVKEDEV